MLSRNRNSIISIYLCIYPYLKTYNFLVEKLIKEKLYYMQMIDNSFILKLSKTTYKHLYATSWSCSIILNRTRNLSLAPAPDCLCQAGPTYSLFSYSSLEQDQSCLSVNLCSLVPFTLYCVGIECVNLYFTIFTASMGSLGLIIPCD